ncbi:PAS domain-containing protein [Clostridium sp. AM58-1XD]|uniref:PAS domain-containing protein n=1 Tax=Clostridium sp. AM58-1XD TaxID=2292307 RepID=UPI0011C12451|nr:PAS domain-containing protein [Clostridium sp. AM58-1XD]
MDYNEKTITELISEGQYKELLSLLEKTQMDLEMLSHAVIGGTARMDLDDGLRVIAASEGYYRMTGYTEEESAEAPFFGRGGNLVLPEDRSSVQDVLQTLCMTNKPISVSYRIRKRDGSIAWNTAYCSHVNVVDGKRTIDVFFVDTTETHKTEQALDSLLNNIPAGVVRASIGNDILITYANREFYRQIGLTPEEFTGIERKGRYLPIVHPDDRSMVWERAKKYISDMQECPSLDYRIITRTVSPDGCVQKPPG